MSKGRPKKMKVLSQKDIALEICRREISKDREVNITEVGRVLRLLFEILSEREGRDVAYFMDKRMKYYRMKAKKKENK